MGRSLVPNGSRIPLVAVAYFLYLSKPEKLAGFLPVNSLAPGN